MIAIVLQLGAIAAAIVLCAMRRHLAGRRRWLLLIGPLLLVQSLLACGDGFVVQKWLGRLLMPLGLVWSLLLASGLVLLWRQRRPQAVAALGVWLLLWLSTSSWVGQGMLERLEADYLTPPPPPREPFDAVLLLGGGTMSRPWGEPQLSPSGDRVTTAARLYHRGLTRRIVTSGSAALGLHPEGTLGPADEGDIILRELGVPADAIVIVNGPRNTSEEIPALAERVRQQGWSRVGLVTSAWHMARALRLAAAVGLEVVPLPSDFRSGEAQANVVELLPSAAGAAYVRLVAWERLGMLVGR